MEFLDMRKQWARIKAGFSGGPFFRSPARGKNPDKCVDGLTPQAREAQMTSYGPVKDSVFTGKSFYKRR